MDKRALDLKQNPSCSSSIIGDTQMSICDESMKRDAKSMGLEDNGDSKSKKKRRSSLSAKRRSITGNVVSNVNFDYDSQETPVPVDDNQITSSADGNEAQTKEERFLPNPANLRMEKTILQLKKQIKTFDNEHAEWKQLLKSFQEKEEKSDILVINPTLPAADIPQEIQDFAAVEYMTSKPIDLPAMKTELDRLLLQIQFHKEACCQDLELIKETVAVVQNTNKLFASNLSQGLTQDVKNNLD